MTTSEDIVAAIEDSLKPIREEIAKRPTEQDIRLMVDKAIEPVRKELDELHAIIPELNRNVAQILLNQTANQTANQQTQIRVAEIGGSLSQLSTIKNDDIREIKAEQTNLFFTISGLIAGLNDMKGTLYGYPDRPNDDPPILKRVADLGDNQVFLRESIEVMGARMETNHAETLAAIATDHAWIEGKRGFEKRLRQQLREVFKTFSAWVARTFIGKVVFGSGIVGSVIAFFATNPIGMEIIARLRALFYPELP